MNQEKIGKFIAELRKEQKMTQSELAEKLGVSTNAVSKWERGICLMDISLLKPLSKYLKVSITEIINGERLSFNDVQSKTEEALESALTYSNKKIKKVKKKNQIILLITILIGLIACFLCYKGIASYVYTVESEENFAESFAKGLSNQDKMNITYKSVIDNNYLVYDDMKIRNDFSSYTKQEETTEYDSTKYHLYDENGVFKSGFWFGTYDTYVDLFTSKSIMLFGSVDNNTVTNNIFDENNIFNSSNRNTFLEKNNITNDIEFLNYVKDNHYLKNNVFMSVKEMKQNYAYNMFVQVMALSLEKFTIIEGKYDGYMFTIDVERNIKEVNILKNDKRYIFTFIGEEFTDTYIKDLLDTLVID